LEERKRGGGKGWKKKRGRIEEKKGMKGIWKSRDFFYF
jgi:hypothetical protein